MAIARHLLEGFKKVSFEESELFEQDFGLKTLIRGIPISCDICKKKYEICNKNITVYNLKLDIKNFVKCDTISFKFDNNLKFEFYDSDENTFMYTSEDENNYYAFIGYDTDYNWSRSEFLNDNYSYAYSDFKAINMFDIIYLRRYLC